MTQPSGFVIFTITKMCTHKRTIKNKYTGEYILVPCGKCAACRQQKAQSLKSRIDSSIGDNVALFCTFTYNNIDIPFVFKRDLQNVSELLKNQSIKVYRYEPNNIHDTSSFDCRFIGSYSLDFAVDYEGNKDFSSVCLDFFPNIRYKDKTFDTDRMAVCWFPDIQNFFKRLRINLSRLGYLKSFQYFAVSEYGSTFKRPHFHALLIVDPKDVLLFKREISIAWKYGDRSVISNGESIQVMRNGSSYVSTYVNCDTVLPDVFKKTFKCKRSMSKYFGMARPSFFLHKILSAAADGALLYRKQVLIDGVPTIVALPFPKYVINRYFPYFKGLSRLSTDEVVQFLCESMRFRICRPDIGYTREDARSIKVRIDNAYKKCRSLLPKSEGFYTIFDYAIDYQRVWNIYNKTILELSYTDKDGILVDPFEQYDNIRFFLDGSIRNEDLFNHYNPNKYYEENCNFFKSNLVSDDYFTQIFFKKQKQSKITNYIQSAGLKQNV